MNKKKQLKIKYPIKTNFMPKLSLWLIVIVAIILFYKFVDVIGLNKDYLICIFMNINENDKNQDLQRENLLPFEGFRVDIYRMYLAPLEQMPMTWVPVWSEDHFIAYLCHVKSQSVHPHP